MPPGTIFAIQTSEARSSGRAWEPIVRWSGPDIEERPDREEHAMAELLRQGCSFPPKHYLPDHQCLIPQRRLHALYEIKIWRRCRFVVNLVVEKLPNELILHILGYVAIMTQRRLHVPNERGLPDAAKRLIGESSVADLLTPLAERALLENSILRFNIEFQKRGAEKIAHLPAFVTTLPGSVRHLELRLEFATPPNRLQYPSQLYSPTSAMPSLHSTFPGLYSLHLVLCGDLIHNPRLIRQDYTEVLDTPCRKGFREMTTFRKTLEDLVDAARANKPDLLVTVEFRYDFYQEWQMWAPLPATMPVVAGSRPAVDVVKEADAKYYQFA